MCTNRKIYTLISSSLKHISCLSYIFTINLSRNNRRQQPLAYALQLYKHEPNLNGIRRKLVTIIWVHWEYNRNTIL